MSLLSPKHSAGFHRPGSSSLQSSRHQPGRLRAQVQRCAAELQPQFAEIDALVGANLRRVQRAFRAARVAPHHFAGSTGYGHGDLGRATLDQARPPIGLSATSRTESLTHIEGHERQAE